MHTNTQQELFCLSHSRGRTWQQLTIRLREEFAKHKTPPAIHSDEEQTAINVEKHPI